MLEAHIVKARAAFTVDVRLRLEAGERLALFGASGAGKSTVLSCLAGIRRRGEILIDDLRLFPPPLPLYQRPLAYLTQSDSLFPHLSVAGNVCFGLNHAAHNGAGEWVKELKQRLGLEAMWDNPVTKIWVARLAGSPWRGCWRGDRRSSYSTNRSPRSIVRRSIIWSRHCESGSGNSASR